MLQEPGVFPAEEKIFMTRANEIAFAKARESGCGPFAAVVVLGRDIVSEGWNRVTLDNDPTAHAEIIAIRSACTRLCRYDLTGCHIYSTCEPCPMCLGAIYWSRLAGIYYSLTRKDASRIGFDDAVIYEEFSLPPVRRKIPAIRIMTENADLAFAEWERNPGKRY